MGLECEKKILVSSAKSRSSVNLEALGRSFMESMKNKGPKIDPWGTPHLMVCTEEQVWLIWLTNSFGVGIKDDT